MPRELRFFDVEDEDGFLAKRGMVVHRCNDEEPGFAHCGVALVCRAPASWREAEAVWDYRACARCWSDPMVVKTKGLYL